MKGQVKSIASRPAAGAIVERGRSSDVVQTMNMKELMKYRTVTRVTSPAIAGDAPVALCLNAQLQPEPPTPHTQLNNGRPIGMSADAKCERAY